MRNRCSLLALVMLFCGSALATTALAAEAASTHGQVEPAVSLKPIPLVQIGKFAVTNSMLLTCIVAAGIIAFVQTATSNINPIPSGIPNLRSWMVDGPPNFL